MNSSHDSDGNSTKRHGQRDRSYEGQPDFPHLEGVPAAFMQADMLLAATVFQYFLHNDEGYLKVKRDTDTKAVHFTWIWTLGKWAHHYVYVRCDYDQAGWGLDLLRDKVLDVAAGSRTPTPDRYNR